MKGFRGYLAFTGLLYRLIIFLAAPVLLIALQVCFLHFGGIDSSLFILVIWSFIDIIADNWLLGGIQSKERSSLDYIRTSKRGVVVFRQILIGDIVRRLVTLTLLMCVAQVCSQVFQGEMMFSLDSMGIMSMAACVLIAFAMSQLGVFVVRYLNYFWISISVAYIVGIVEFVALVMSQLIYKPVVWIVLFGAVAIVCVVLPVREGMRKLIGGYYDE